MLFNPWVVCFSLIVGGAILLWVDQLDHDPHEHDATRFPLLTYLWIGVAQCLAMIPGVSRSGASIVAAMLLGADKRAAAEFSFFLAIPTMVGAFVYDFYKSRAEMTTDHLGIIAIGFVVSFITAIIVVRMFLSYVTSRGFTLFAWWRVIVGTLGLVALAMGSSLLMVRRREAPSRTMWPAILRAAARPRMRDATRSSAETAPQAGSARDIAERRLPSNPA